MLKEVKCGQCLNIQINIMDNYTYYICTKRCRLLDNIPIEWRQNFENHIFTKEENIQVNDYRKHE